VQLTFKYRQDYIHSIRVCLCGYIARIDGLMCSLPLYGGDKVFHTVCLSVRPVRLSYAHDFFEIYKLQFSQCIIHDTSNCD